MISFLHDDLSSLYRLIERLLRSTENEEIQIIAGKLPETFPDEIPFPPGATIIGSAVYVDEWRSRIKVFFDVNFDLEQLYDFYQENLGANWNREEYFRGGFTNISDSSPRNMEDMEFLNETRNTELNINVVDIRGSNIMVALELWNSSTSRAPLAPFPTLSSPPNVRILRATGSDREIDAKLKTNLDLPELITHYAACFEREGWVENDSGKKENFVWRHWEMRNENNKTWFGVLQITSLAETEHYLASARVFQTEN